MSEKKPISANDFINKAVKLIEIDGFAEGEKITLKIKPVSLLAMMTKGRLPNELKMQVASLFNAKDSKQVVKGDDIEELSLMQQLMDKVCQDCMVEPKFEEVGEYMTDGQKTQVFMQAQGNVKDYIPNNEK